VYSGSIFVARGGGVKETAVLGLTHYSRRNSNPETKDGQCSGTAHHSGFGHFLSDFDCQTLPVVGIKFGLIFRRAWLRPAQDQSSRSEVSRQTSDGRMKGDFRTKWRPRFTHSAACYVA